MLFQRLLGARPRRGLLTEFGLLQLQLGPDRRHLMSGHRRRLVTPRVADVGCDVRHLLIAELPGEAWHGLERRFRCRRRSAAAAEDQVDEPSRVTLLGDCAAR